LIVIELTETTTESDLIRLTECVQEFRKAGFDVSVDDFGVGYSSMSMIKDVPFSEIKIDRSFISSDSISDRDMIMMKHIITLADDLGMTTIAEGVETKEQIELLRKYGCYRAQGYIFDKPLTKEDFEKVLDNPDYSSRG
jgi:EAL domain-containing protein (putative c-di-GMP-specific phosphodiesterase class I)